MLCIYSQFLRTFLGGDVKLATKTKSETGGAAQFVGQTAEDNVPDAPKWTFLTNHAHVLTVLDSDPDLVLREVALRVGITERAVQRIVVDLEESGFLLREKIGRQNHYKVLKDQPLRHPIEAHRTIGDLLELITG